MESLDVEELELIPSDYESVGGIGFPIDLDLLQLLELPCTSFEKDPACREVCVQVKAVMLSAVLVALENHRKDLLEKKELTACLLNCPLCGLFDAEFAATLNYLGADGPLRRSLSRFTAQLDRLLLAWRWDPFFRPQDEPKQFLAEIQSFENVSFYSNRITNRKLRISDMQNDIQHNDTSSQMAANMTRTIEVYQAEIIALEKELACRSSLIQELQVAKEMYTLCPLRHQYMADLLKLTGIVLHVSNNGDRNLDVLGPQIVYPWQNHNHDQTDLYKVADSQSLQDADAASRCAVLLQRTIPLPKACLETAFKTLQCSSHLRTFVESAFLQGFSLTGPFRNQTCLILEEPYLSILLETLLKQIRTDWEMSLKQEKRKAQKQLEAAEQNTFRAFYSYDMMGRGSKSTAELSLEKTRARLRCEFQLVNGKEVPKTLTLNSISINNFRAINVEYRRMLADYRTARLALMFDTTQAEIREKLLPEAAVVVGRAPAAHVAEDADTIRQRQKIAMEARLVEQEKLKAMKQADKREQQKAALKAARKK